MTTTAVWMNGVITIHYISDTRVVIGALYAKPSTGFVELAVEPEWRRKGIGSIIMSIYESQLRHHTKLRQIIFTCAPDNLGALMMYRKLGYRVLNVPGTDCVCTKMIV